MKRKFVTSLLFLLAANLLVKPIWILLIDVSVQNAVGAATYGTYFAIFNFTYLFHVLLDFGINNFNNRAVSREQGFLKEYFSNLIVLKWLLAFAYYGVVFLFAKLSGYSAFELKLVAWLGVNQVLLSFILYFRSNIQALQLFKTDSLVSILDRSLMIIICALLLWGGITDQPFQIEWFVYAQTAALGLTFLISFFIVLAKAGFFKPRFKPAFFKDMLRQTFPYALLGILMSMYNRVDGYMIERLLPDTGELQAGIYAASYRLLDAVNMIGFLFATLLLPIFSKMLKQREPVNDLLRFSFQLMFAFAGIVSISCLVYQEGIMTFLYDDASRYYGQVFGLLILSLNAVASVYIFGTLLTANGSLRALNFIAFGGLLLNVVLNFFLIRSQGALGAALATLITQFLVAFAHYFVTQVVLHLKTNWIILVRCSLFVLAGGGIALIFNAMPGNWAINFLLLVISLTALAFLLRLIHVAELWQLLKDRNQS